MPISIIAVLIALLALPLVPAAAQQTSSTDTTLTTLSGTVYDSLSGRPLAGALVQLAPSGQSSGIWSVRTDEEGAFQLSGVRPGEYLVGFMHPFLDSLGLEVPPQILKVDGNEPLQLALAIPTASSIRSQLCPATTPSDSSGLLLGFLRDASSNAHLDSGTVILGWTELVMSEKAGARAVQRSIPARANHAGWFAVCGLPTAAPISAHAELGENSTGYIDLLVPPRGVLHQDFSIPTDSATIAVAVNDSDGTAAGDSIRRGSARLSGVVLNEKGKPLADAQLLVRGSDVSGTSRDDGSFLLTGLPAGTQMLEARHLGYAPELMTVDLVSEHTASVTLTFDERADVLQGVTVYGKRSRYSRDMEGFIQRRKLGFGRFITQADVERQRPQYFSDLLRTIPGVRYARSGDFEYKVISERSKCPLSVYINGLPLKDPSVLDMLVIPEEVAGVEIYTSISQVLPFGEQLGCGSLVIWLDPFLHSDVHGQN